MGRPPPVCGPSRRGATIQSKHSAPRGHRRCGRNTVPARGPDIPTPTTTRSTRPPTRPVGAAGTRNIGGFIIPEGELNREFTGQQLYRTVDRMVRTDPVVRAALLMVVLPITEASWTVEPASGEPEDLEVAEFVRRNLLGHLDWPRVVWNLLPVRYGHAVCETVYEPVDWDLTYTGPDGDEVQSGRRVFWALAALQPRLGRTIWRWTVDAVGRLESVTQQRLDPQGSTYSEVVIPADQLVVTTNEREGDDYLGVSVCRAMYRAWYTKERLEVIDAMKIERAGVGVPVGYVPDQDWETDSPGMQEVLAGLRSGEESHLVLRAGDTQDQPGQRVEMLDMKASAQADALPSLQYHVTQILWAVLGAWQNLGHGEVGARATATVQDDPFYLALRAVAGNVAAALNRQLIPRLVGFNYQTDRYPVLRVEDIQGTDTTGFIQSVSDAIQKGAITHDDQLEAHLRGVLGLPDRMADEDDGDPADAEAGVGDAAAAEGLEEAAAEAEAGGVEFPEDDPATPEDEFAIAVREYVRRRGDREQTVREHSRRRRTQALTQDTAGRVWWREPTTLERHVPLTEIDEHVEQQRGRVEAECRQTVDAIADALATTLTESPDGDLDAPTDLRDKLAAVLEGALQDVTRFGRQTVRRELASQKGRDVALAAPPETDDGLFRWLQKRARAGARAVVARMVTEGERLQTRGVEQRGRAVESLREAARLAVRAEAVEVVSQAFGAGRKAETRQAVHAGDVAYAVYSSVLDGGTCPECGPRDGRRYEVDSPEFTEDYPPLGVCHGRDRCRCMMVLVATDEQEADRA